MNSHWTALNTTEFSYQIWSCPILLPKPKRADWPMCFRLLRWIFMSLFWLVCRNLMGSYEFELWWCGSDCVAMITYVGLYVVGPIMHSCIHIVGTHRWRRMWAHRTGFHSGKHIYSVSRLAPEIPGWAFLHMPTANYNRGLAAACIF